MAKCKEKVIRAAIRNSDVSKIKVSFTKEPFTPDEFTCLIMALVETYTEGLLVNNSREDVYQHFNNAFGIFLNKLLPEEKIYEVSEAHKDFKKNADEILTQPETEEVKKNTEDNRFAAYLLARDILINEMHLTEESADILLNKRLGTISKLNVGDVGGEVKKD
jgi:hypothetical protein